jgi:hypothetical protein
MKIRIQVVIEHDDGGEPEIEELVCLSCDTDHLTIEQLGLSLDEAKDILAKTQTTLIAHQAEAFVERHCCCQKCGAVFQKNGTHQMTVRTLFGAVKLISQRFYRCSCQSQEAPGQKKNRSSFSPLAEGLPERTTPEFRYLQAKWSSLMSYGLTSQLLEEVLPLSKRISTATLSRCVQRITQRADSELGEEQEACIEGCQRDWEDLPLPGAPLIVGIDGGYVHGREGADRKAGFFEVIVGKGMSEDVPSQRFGFVNTYESKPRRRLYEMLMAQGMQMNQRVTFLSDGGDTVRDLQLYLNPQAEHLLDWFHITMRLTVLSQFVKGLRIEREAREAEVCKKKKKRKAEEEDAFLSPDELEKQLERIKWYLWHGNAHDAISRLEELKDDLVWVEEVSLSIQKLQQAVHEFHVYITTNQSFLVNYGDRYRNGETISSAFVESTVNEIISKRFAKKQQMRWTKEGAQQLLQVRIQVLNNTLRETFCRWYPSLAETAFPLGEEMTG